MIPTELASPEEESPPGTTHELHFSFLLVAVLLAKGIPRRWGDLSIALVHPGAQSVTCSPSGGDSQ